MTEPRECAHDAFMWNAVNSERRCLGCGRDKGALFDALRAELAAERERRERYEEALREICTYGVVGGGRSLATFTEMAQAALTPQGYDALNAEGGE